MQVYNGAISTYLALSTAFNINENTLILRTGIDTIMLKTCDDQSKLGQFR